MKKIAPARCTLELERRWKVVAIILVDNVRPHLDNLGIRDDGVRGSALVVARGSGRAGSVRGLAIGAHIDNRLEQFKKVRFVIWGSRRLRCNLREPVDLLVIRMAV